MPFTPYHVGPALLIALLLYPLLDLPTFLIASLIIDLEHLAVILGVVDWSMHGVFHSLTIGTVIGFTLALPMYIVRKHTKPIQIGITIPEEPSMKNLTLTSVLGVWIHVLLDSFTYSDLNLFYPIHINPLLGLISSQKIINFCLLSIPVSFIIYVIRQKIIPRITSQFTKQELDKEPEIIGVPENGPYIVYYNPDTILEEEAEKKQKIETEHELNHIASIEVSPYLKSEEEFLKDIILPDIILGVETSPIQWGIIGKNGKEKVAVDLNEPHIVFVCGKQGSGKGYSIGIITEMLLSKTIPKISQVKKPATIIVFHKPREDMRSEFWSIVEPNTNIPEVKTLREEYDIAPQRVITGNNFRIFIDPFVYKNERNRFEKDYDTRAYPIAINPSRLTAEDWPYVLSIGRKSGSLYVKKIFQIIKKTQYDDDFGLNTIRRHINESDLNPNQKSFANMRLETLEDYLNGGDFLRNLQIGGVNIFDLRKIMMEPDDIFSVMMLVISSLLNDMRTEREQFVFVINEAHDYLRTGLSKDFTDYINYLIRKKRHAGTWLMLDTHFPEDVDSKVIKGSDIKIFHKSDVISGNLLKQVVEGTPIPPHQLVTGQAIVRSDKSNLGPDQITIVNMRPRITHHGGATKTAI
jgi:hypothetical protein